jgi:hypothetical protein
MSRIDDLAPDQRAVLQLLLKQGKSYDELATLLRISPDAVRERAVTALETLGPRDAPLPADRRAEVSDYLLGQQSASARQDTRDFLGGSAAGRAWARVVSGELRPIAGDALPEIPAEQAEVEEAFEALDARTARRAEVQRSSRRGGALLLAGVALVLAAAIVLIVRGGDDDGDGERASTPSTQTQTTGGGQPQVLNQINLEASGGNAAGVMFLLRQDGELAVAVQAQGLAATTERRFYAVWLTGENRRARPLGFTPVVEGSGERRGRLEFASALPREVRQYQRLLITREASRNPSRPGTTVLSGPLDFQR